MSAEINQNHFARKNLILWILDIISLVFVVFYHFQPVVTGLLKLDGGIGVLLGLYICSHPAANFLDMLFFNRGPWRVGASGRKIAGWVAHNLVVMVLGWTVILSGTLRFTSK